MQMFYIYSTFTCVFINQNEIFSLGETERYLTQSYNKTPDTHRKIQNATWQTQKRRQNFD